MYYFNRLAETRDKLAAYHGGITPMDKTAIKLTPDVLKTMFSNASVKHGPREAAERLLNMRNRLLVRSNNLSNIADNMEKGFDTFFNLPGMRFSHKGVMGRLLRTKGNLMHIGLGHIGHPKHESVYLNNFVSRGIEKAVNKTNKLLSFGKRRRIHELNNMSGTTSANIDAVNNVIRSMRKDNPLFKKEFKAIGEEYKKHMRAIIEESERRMGHDMVTSPYWSYPAFIDTVWKKNKYYNPYLDKANKWISGTP